MSAPMAGKVIVVTGGAAGIGRATAVAFARQGASVVIADVDVVEGEKAVSSIRENGGAAICVRADVSKPTDVQHMVASAVGHYGAWTMPSIMPVSRGRTRVLSIRPKKIGIASWRPT